MLINELLTILAIVIIFMSYIVWRKRSALVCREELADKLDSFLAGTAPEHLKEQVFMLFHICMKHTAILSFTYFLIFESNHSTPQTSDEPGNQVSKCRKEDLDDYKDIIFKSIQVAFKLSPIIFVLCGIVLSIFAMIKISMNKLTTKNSMAHAEDILDKSISRYHHDKFC